MISPALEIVSALILVTIISALIGAPLANILINSSTQIQFKIYPFIYASLIIGYGVLHLLLLMLSMLLGIGFSTFSQPVVLIIIFISLIFIVSRIRLLSSLPYKVILNTFILGLLLVVSTIHVIGPVLLQYWDMAYATGDDAARWYMVVSYFQDHFFEYHNVTDTSLRYGLAERPMQITSGAIMMAIFGLTPALAYSLSAASSMLMSAASFMLIFEGIFGVRDKKNRYILWVVTGIFFGFFGSFINYYFTGRTTHHFSVFPMLFSLAFIAIDDVWWKRAIWFSLANLLLALGYSIRFPMNFAVTVGCIILFQWFMGQISFRSVLRNAGAMLFALMITCIITWAELKALVLSDRQGFFMQRPGRYGLDGSNIDVFFKWSGVIGTYESISNLTPLVTWTLFVTIASLIGVAVYIAIWGRKRYPAYSAIISVNFTIGLLMIAVGNYYVAWKSSLYWTIYILLGLVEAVFILLSMKDKKIKFFGYTLLAVILSFICFTSRQLPMYKEMVDERVTKVDAQSYEMVKLLKIIKNDCSQCKPQIFGFDYSAERHLLLREIFRDFEWQPIRGKELWFEHDVFLHQSREELDQYRYEFLLYGASSKCDLFDFSGNKDALIYNRYPFKIYGPNSSLLEPIKGIEFRRYGTEAENLNCSLYGGEITDDKAELVFANNGKHSWLNLSFRVVGEDKKNFQQELKLTSSKGNIKIIKTDKNLNSQDYTIHISNLIDSRLIELNITRLTEDKIYLTKAIWGR